MFAASESVAIFVIATRQRGLIRILALSIKLRESARSQGKETDFVLLARFIFNLARKIYFGVGGADPIEYGYVDI